MDKIEVNTDLSLLERMGDSQLRNQAWNDFVERYARLFFHWFHLWHVDPFEMEDVLQETLLRVLGNVRHFQRRRHGSFRAWLRTLAYNCWKQLAENAERQLALRGVDNSLNENWDRLKTRMAEDSLLKIFDAWAMEELLNMAHSRVRRRVEPETWECYRLFVLENEPIVAVTAAMNAEPQMIYARVFRVRRLVREDMERIESPEP